MKILNDKYGLSYLSGNAQILFANTGTTQQFNTILANTFTNLGNTFTINTAGVYGLSFETNGNVSGANIIISGNLYLKEGFGSIGQYITRTASGISWTNATFDGGTLNQATSVNNSLFASNLSTANAQITGGNAALTTLFASNLSTANATITGGNIGMNNNRVVSLISNVYTGNLFATNMSTANAQITGGNAALTTLFASNISTTNITVSGNTSISTTTGALVVTGGAGFSGNINVGGNITGRFNTIHTNQGSNVYINNTSLVTLNSGSRITGGSNTLITVTGLNSSNATITGGNTATSTTTGALVVTGGAGVSGNLYAGAIYENTTRVATTGKAIAMSIVFGG